MKGKQKKPPEGYSERRKKWQKNRDKLLEIISSGKYNSKEIISKSPIKRTATLDHIKKMKDDEKLIEVIRENGKSYHILTDKGKKIINYQRTQRLSLENMLSDRIIFD